MIFVALVSTLLLASPAPSNSTDTQATVAHSQAGFDAAVDALAVAVSATNYDPSLKNREHLSAALKDLQRFPQQLASDVKASSRRVTGYLVLARAHLLANDKSAAREAVAQALFVRIGRELPAAEFGPSLVELVAEVDAEFSLTLVGKISFFGPQDCTYYLNEREAMPEQRGLPLGTYRAGSACPGRDFIERSLNLSETEPVASWTIPEAPAPIAHLAQTSEVNVDLSASSTRPNHKVRWLPRWASISGTAIGLATAAAGSWMWAVDGFCPSSSKTDTGCFSRYKTGTAGKIAVPVGSALVVGSLVVLIRDELASKRNAKSKR